MTADGPARVRLFPGDAGHLVAEVRQAWPAAEIQVSGYDDGFDVALVWDADGAETACFAARQNRLRWLHTRASGVPAQLASALRDRDTLVTNGAGTHGLAVAEHVASLILAHYRRLSDLLDAQRESRWQPPPAQEVRGKTVGVIGLGDLGRSTARLLTALGAVVVGLRRGHGDVPEVHRTYRADGLAEFLGQLDALVIAAPLTVQTRSMIGERELALLPRGAYLVNVGRGPIVREEALVSALESGHLAGAALDVFAAEPLPASSLLWSLPGVVVTPHCADSTEQTDQRCLDLLLEQIRRYRSGRRPHNAVDLARGY
ncbi:D-2-hydroxyacid dehydrogenase [Streptomyces sp. NBC_01102]|uniref:D-2-hydroxyacid dehydrogenase n=1 Tax=unclassified Streptomyces TaxID=2593676 RepID=UPI00386E6DDF|nr:D-2-hydroxyacid dehydrogenase [Streptomyces sp. NBC_01102]